VTKEENPVRFTSLRACVVVCLASLITAVALAGAQVKVPADFTFERGKDSPGLVTFSHEQHKAKVEKCQSCHVAVFKMKKGTTGPLAMDKMKAGAQCGACHNGKTEIAGKAVFTVDDKANCERCHKKK
jgi:c(7)-type cytochrome triheme protein